MCRVAVHRNKTCSPSDDDVHEEPEKSRLDDPPHPVAIGVPLQNRFKAISVVGHLQDECQGLDSVPTRIKENMWFKVIVYLLQYYTSSKIIVQ